MKKTLQKKEFLCIAALILVSLAWILWLKRPKEHVRVDVIHDGKTVLEFSPDEDAVYHIDGDCGGLDVEVKDGRWHVIHEQCPNHICAHTGWASAEDMIVITCLPNDIVIRMGEYTYEAQ